MPIDPAAARSAQQKETARAATAAALDAQRDLAHTPGAEGTADATDAQRELRDNQVRR